MTKTKAALLKPALSKKQELELMVKEYEKKVKELEKELIKFALKHNVPLYLGEYGADGRMLVLQDGIDPFYPESEYPIDKSRGEWYYSSESC